jgi:hypothetical protein
MPRGLRRRSAAAWFAGIVGWNPDEGTYVCLLSLYVVLSCLSKDLYDGLITRPEKAHLNRT